MAVSSAKKPSYYVTIDGKRYDRKALEAAERLQQSGTGKITKAKAKELAKAMASDGTFSGPVVTRTEVATANKIRKEAKFTSAGRRELNERVPKTLDKPSSYYKQIDGKKYDRAALELAEASQKRPRDGRISAADAGKIAGALKDGTFKGPALTETELRTADRIRGTGNFTPKGRKVFDAEVPVDRKGGA